MFLLNIFDLSLHTLSSYRDNSVHTSNDAVHASFVTPSTRIQVFLPKFRPGPTLGVSKRVGETVSDATVRQTKPKPWEIDAC